MIRHVRSFVLLVLCSFAIAGCGGANLKDSAGERLSLSEYDRVAIKPVEVASSITLVGISDDLAAHLSRRLSESISWDENADHPNPTDATKQHGFPREIDLAVKIVKARYPSRSKTIWLGAAHKMTCHLEVHDRATNTLLGSATVSSSVEPLMGNAGLLNGGTIGIIGRACFDTRKHDTNSLLAHMAKDIVKVLDRAKKQHPHSDGHADNTISTSDFAGT
jgi:hypothetical protein